MSVRKIETPSGPRWEVSVYENGRGSKQLKRRFEKRVEADTWLFNFEKAKDEKARNPFLGMSFDDKFFHTEAERWLTHARTRFSLGHVMRSTQLVEQIGKKYGLLPIQSMTPEWLTNYQQAELKKDLSDSTVNRSTEVLVAILNYAVKQRRIPFNPSSGFEKLRVVRLETLHWDVPEAQDYLRHINAKYPRGFKDRWIYLAYLIALNTGIRAGEVWGLKPSDFSPENNTLTISRQICRLNGEFLPPKGKKVRTVPANKDLLLEVAFWVQWKKIGPHDLIFKNDEGRPICHDNFATRRFQSDMKSWGGRKIRFHDFRHTAATLMVADGIDLKTVQAICGHTDIQTTMGYAHRMNGAVQRVAEGFSLTPSSKKEVS